MASPPQLFSPFTSSDYYQKVEEEEYVLIPSPNDLPSEETEAEDQEVVDFLTASFDFSADSDSIFNLLHLTLPTLKETDEQATSIDAKRDFEELSQSSPDVMAQIDSLENSPETAIYFKRPREVATLLLSLPSQRVPSLQMQFQELTERQKKKVFNLLEQLPTTTQDFFHKTIAQQAKNLSRLYSTLTRA